MSARRSPGDCCERRHSRAGVCACFCPMKFNLDLHSLDLHKRMMATNAMKQMHSKYSFEPNAILRGAQLTLVGAYRGLQNPSLFTSEHYKQALFAVLAGIAIRLIVAIPVRSLPAMLLLI